MFLHPLGLLALLAVPAVLGLHLFRRRHRPRVVSALHLWASEDATSAAGRRRERLRRTPSLLCELLCAALLALALAGPTGCGPGVARHLVVVLDDSASMSAELQGGSPRERAAAALREQVGALPAGSRVTLLATGARARVLCGPAAYPEEALAALPRWRPSAPRHDVSPALALALQLAGEGAVWLYTDRFEPELLPPEVGLRAFGRGADNVALTRATRVRADEGGRAAERVLLTVANASALPARRALALRAEGRELYAEQLALGPGERQQLSLALPPGAPAVEARLEGDALALDDRALLAPPAPRTVAVATTFGPEAALRLGLATAEQGGLGHLLAALPDVRAAADAADADVLVGSDLRPTSAVDAACLSFESGPGERVDLVGPFLLEKRHPLLEGVTLEGVIWSADGALALPGTPLVSAGELALLSELHSGTHLVLLANLDLARTNLHRTPDWPILLANLVELRRRELPGPAATNLALGLAFEYRGAPEGELVLRGPSGERRVRSQGHVLLEDLDEPGLYELALGDAPPCRFALHFADAAESDLRALSSGERVPASELAERRAGASPIVRALLALALAGVALDWTFLRPRRRAAGRRT